MPRTLNRIARLSLLALAAAAPLHAQRAAPAPRTDRALTARLEALTRGFHGQVGIYVRNLRTGATVELRADSVYPTASMIKVPILLTLYDQVGQGKLDLDARVPYPDTLHYRYVESTDVAGYMVAGDTLPLSELAFLMLTVSDNVASLWIQALVGGGAAVNQWLEGHGFRQTRVNSRTPGREAARSVYGWGQTTPREIAEALVMIRQGRAVSPRASEAMYRLLTNSYWKDVGLSQIPPTVQAASKQGFVDRSRSEVLLVNAPSGDYVLSVITKDQADTGYEPGNEGHRLIRAVSRAVYEHFNPGDRWRPQ
ncbi:MAG TPA: serine hydrolase [Longimicrobium sp.]|jgi:beta-lactamase class A|nr:serine hydrolase [Longimicrobium sp.]